jgi:ribosomal protein L19
MDIIKKITEKQINPNVPEFRVGDTLRVDVRIIEGKSPIVVKIFGKIGKLVIRGIGKYHKVAVFSVSKLSYYGNLING